MTREEMLNECVSRDKAIVQLNHLKSDWDDDWNVAIRKCIETIKSMPPVTPQPKMGSSSENPNKWISLDEKEPKDGQLILVTFVNRYKKRYVKIAEFIEENYRKYDGKIDQRYYGFHSVGNIYEWADEAVAWMPLPTPYQQEITTGAEGSDKE